METKLKLNEFSIDCRLLTFKMKSQVDGTRLVDQVAVHQIEQQPN